jgi:hypothetical protein
VQVRAGLDVLGQRPANVEIVVSVTVTSPPYPGVRLLVGGAPLMSVDQPVCLQLLQQAELKGQEAGCSG